METIGLGKFRVGDWIVAGEYQVAGGIIRGLPGKLPAGSMKRKIGIPDVPQTCLVSFNIGGSLRVGSQKCVQSVREG